MNVEQSLRISHKTYSHACACLDGSLGLQKVEAPRIFRQWAREGSKGVSRRHQPLLPLRGDAWYSCLLEAHRRQDHSAAGGTK